MIERYEDFRVVATVGWILLAVLATWAGYRIARKSYRGLIYGGVVGLVLALSLDDSSVERSIWVRYWPKPPLDSIFAEQCALLWSVPRHRPRSPEELAPIIIGATKAGLRRLPASALRHYLEYTAWVAQTKDERLCANPISIGSAVWRAPTTAFRHMRQFMLEAVRAEIRDDPEDLVSATNQSDILTNLQQPRPER
jgi:hypothetical protein